MKYYITSALMADEAKNILKNHGKLIEIHAHPYLPEPEKYHADMQCAKINNNTLVCAPNINLSNINKLDNLNIIYGSSKLGEKYPNNIAYNVLRCGNIFFHNTAFTDEEVKKQIEKYEYNLCHTKQGYTGCSSITIPLGLNKFLLLSSDPGIVSLIENMKLDNVIVRYFDETKNILLPGYDHGFIGGCCGYDNDLGLIIYGKINEQLKKLSNEYNFQIFSIYNSSLTDIGGISVMYSSQ